jgi:succinyl-CoA--D-citramalate CoA-transferase
MADRVAHREAIDVAVAEWMLHQPTDAALVRLDRCGVVAGRINSVAEVIEDAHVRAREAITTLTDRDLGPLRMPAPVPRLSDTPGRIRWAGARIGEHNEAVFRDWLGLDHAELERLSHEGVI